MKLNIRGDKLEITDAIRDYVEDKLGRLDKYFKDSDINANVLLKVKGNRQIIEVTVPTDKFIVKEKSGYRAIINIANKISDDSFRSTEGVDSILAEAENSIMNVAQNRRSENFRPIEEIVAEAIDKIEKVISSALVSPNSKNLAFLNSFWASIFKFGSR